MVPFDKALGESVDMCESVCVLPHVCVCITLCVCVSAYVSGYMCTHTLRSSIFLVMKGLELVFSV